MIYFSAMTENLSNMPSRLGELLLNTGSTVTAAESCTGGGICHAITDVAGSSQWFHGGFVTYSNAMKHQLLGVDMALIEDEGAVSNAVVSAMLLGAIREAKADVGVAVSGIAGPGGSRPGKPVGTVYVAWGNETALCTERFEFSGDRKAVRDQAVVKCFDRLIQWLEKNTV